MYGRNANFHSYAWKKVDFGDSSGGPLNRVQDHFRLTDVKKTVSAVQLAVVHHIKSPQMMKQSMQDHYEGKCKNCKIKCNTTVELLGEKLFGLQEAYCLRNNIKVDKEEFYDLEECTKWIYNLYCVNTLKGVAMEGRIQDDLNNSITNSSVKVEKGTQEDDEGGGVDLVVKKDDEVVMGIQVKPISYILLANDNIKKVNEEKNKKWGKPVHYVYYDLKTKNESCARSFKDCLDEIKQI